MNKAEKIDLVDTDQIVPWNKNANKHSDEQIDRLCKLIKYNGFRDPLIVSKRSGFLICGHARLMSAKKLGLKQVPVIYQDFENEAEEYQFHVAHNAIAEWSALDLSAINTEILDFGPEFNVDMLGVKEFNLVPNFEPGLIEDQGQLDQKKPVVTQCPNCGECFDANENKPQN